MEENVIIPLPPKNNRNKGHKYIDKNNNIVIWNGNRLHCEHGKEKCKCKICGGVGVCIHNKVKGICKECGGKQLYKHEKLKERYGKDFFKYDIRIECSCSGKIPDWFVDCYNFVLNIECDENQHKGNETSCENKRLCELFLDCNSRPFVCIRFNPDSYKIEEKKIDGCFDFDEKNNIIVNQEEFEKRFELLVEKIEYYLENSSKKDIECIKLFYDESNTKFKM